MDGMINGIHVKSFSSKLNAEEAVPFSDGKKEILKSLVLQMTVEELLALPSPPAKTPCDGELLLQKGEKKAWRNI